MRRGLATAAGVDAAKLVSLARKTASGVQPTQDEVNVLGQFDAVLSAVLDTAYERGDQKYRNASKCLAMVVATIMGAVGGWIVFGGGFSYFGTSNSPSRLWSAWSPRRWRPSPRILATSLQAAVGAASTLKR